MQSNKLFIVLFITGWKIRDCTKRKKGKVLRLTIRYVLFLAPITYSSSYTRLFKPILYCQGSKMHILIKLQMKRLFRRNICLWPVRSHNMKVSPEQQNHDQMYPAARWQQNVSGNKQTIYCLLGPSTPMSDWCLEVHRIHYHLHMEGLNLLKTKLEV